MSDESPLKDFSESQKSEKNKRTSIHSVPAYFFVFLIIALIGLFTIVHYKDLKHLPTQITVAEEKNYPGRFIGERSQNHLRQLTSIGPKVVGSYENEVLAVDFLKREISFIQQQAHPNQNLEVDVQVVSGEFYLDFVPHGLVNIYKNVQNVIVRVSPTSGSNKNSLLLNSHFDSVPSSPGASDDGISVTTMLEVLRVLSRSSKPLKHNVIFLFNGAEENPLQAAHGFIVHHKWAAEVQAVINMEAAGLGGREIIFQAGPGHPWLMSHYAAVAPHPHAQVVAEEIFQNNFIPSDTDFRVFRDFGHIPGIDMAFSQNGYVYHTKYDRFQDVPAGSFQHIGDNVLALTKSLASSEELSNTTNYKDGKLVYFDVLGYFIVLYSTTTGVIINVSSVLLMFFVFFSTFKSLKSGNSSSQLIKLLCLSAGSQLLGWLVGILISAFIGVILDSNGYSMSWYAKPWLTFGLYVFPSFAGSLLFLIILNYKKSAESSLGLSLQTQLHTLATMMLWAIPTLVLTLVGIRASYVFMLNVLWPGIAHLIIIYGGFRYSVRSWLWLYIIALLPPTILHMYHSTKLLDLFIPISGRIGSNKNVDVIIAVLCSFCCILTTSVFVPLITLIRKPGKILMGLFFVTVATILVVIYTPYGFPYSVEPGKLAPERYWVFHTERTFHDSFGNVRKHDSGFFLLNMDRNSPTSIKDYVKDINDKAERLSKSCETEIFCGIPIYTSRMSPICNESSWIPAPPPVIHLPTQLKLTSQKLITPDTRRLSFTATGPDHMGLYISPKESVSLVNWSFIDEVPKSGPLWHGRPTYFVMFGYGKTQVPWDFYLDLKAPVTWTGPTVDIVLTGHYMHEDENQTPAFKRFLNSFPQWTHVTAWMSTLKTWMY